MTGGPPPGPAPAAAPERMEAFAAAQPGFLRVESARDSDGAGVTVSYWRTEADVRAWHAVAQHRAAQSAGRDRWYERFEVRVCRVERASGFARPVA